MTIALIAVLVVVHVASAWAESTRGAPLTDALLGVRSPGFRMRVGGQHVAALRGGDWWRLATSVLLHTSAVHLVLNALALAAVGTLLERWAGGLRLAGWFAIGGVAGSVASWAGGMRMSDGASGAVFGLLAIAWVVGLRERSRLTEGVAWLLGPVLGGFVVLNVVLSLVVPALDPWAHGGGLAAGIGLGLITGRWNTPWPGRVAYGAAVLTFCAACAVGWG